MDLWMIIAGAVGFTLLVMLMGPWMWSSSWTKWRVYGGEGKREAPRKDAPPRDPHSGPTPRS
jgi:hypothetical protein